MKVYVVNCDTGRFDRMKNASKFNSIELEYVKSYISTDEIVTRRGSRAIERKMTEPRLVAMTLGHMKAIEEFLKSNEDIGIIAEDDVRFHNEFEQYADICSSYIRGSNVDVLSVGFVNFPFGKKISYSGISIIENVGLGNPWGAQCYMITREYASRFLEIFKEEDISLPYSNYFSPDWVIFDPVLGTRRSTLCLPIAIESPDEQSIGITGSNKPNLLNILDRNNFSF